MDALPGHAQYRGERRDQRQEQLAHGQRRPGRAGGRGERDPGLGVIVAQGGRFGGRSLYVLDGKLKYCHNFLYLVWYPVAAPDLLPAGDVKVQYKFKYDGGETGAGGTGELLRQQEEVAEQ